MICASPKLNISTSVAHQTMGLQQLFLECFALVLTYEKPKSESTANGGLLASSTQWRFPSFGEAHCCLGVTENHSVDTPQTFKKLRRIYGYCEKAYSWSGRASTSRFGVRGCYGKWQPRLHFPFHICLSNGGEDLRTRVQLISATAATFLHVLLQARRQCPQGCLTYDSIGRIILQIVGSVEQQFELCRREIDC